MALEDGQVTRSFCAHMYVCMYVVFRFSFSLVWFVWI